MQLESIPLLRGLAHTQTPYHVGTVAENLLGAQVLRTLCKEAVYRLRRARVTAELADHAAALERDGVVAIPDFLTPPQFAAVRREFESVALDFRPLRGAAPGRLEAAYHSVGPGARATIEHVGRNAVINGLAAGVIRRRVDVLPAPAFHVYRLRDPLSQDNDVENVLHADLHAPTAKAFFFISDVDETNGAFHYVKGSHRLSLARLAHEYDLSVRSARLRRGSGHVPAHLLAERGELKRSIISPRARARLGIRETAFCVRANTLVLANNRGFHRRGEFTSARPREMIYLNYRHLERAFF